MVDQIVLGLGNQVWQQTLLRAQQLQNMNVSTTEDLSSLMVQTFHALSFFPVKTYMLSPQSQFSIPMTPIPTTQQHQTLRGKG